MCLSMMINWFELLDASVNRSRPCNYGTFKWPDKIMNLQHLALNMVIPESGQQKQGQPPVL